MTSTRSATPARSRFLPRHLRVLRLEFQGHDAAVGPTRGPGRWCCSRRAYRSPARAWPRSPSPAAPATCRVAPTPRSAACPRPRQIARGSQRVVSVCSTRVNISSSAFGSGFVTRRRYPAIAHPPWRRPPAARGRPQGPSPRRRGRRGREELRPVRRLARPGGGRSRAARRVPATPSWVAIGDRDGGAVVAAFVVCRGAPRRRTVRAGNGPSLPDAGMRQHVIDVALDRLHRREPILRRKRAVPEEVDRSSPRSAARSNTSGRTPRPHRPSRVRVAWRTSPGPSGRPRAPDCCRAVPAARTIARTPRRRRVPRRRAGGPPGPRAAELAVEAFSSMSLSRNAIAVRALSALGGSRVASSRASASRSPIRAPKAAGN